MDVFRRLLSIIRKLLIPLLIWVIGELFETKNSKSELHIWALKSVINDLYLNVPSRACKYWIQINIMSAVEQENKDLNRAKMKFNIQNSVVLTVQQCLWIVKMF